MWTFCARDREKKWRGLWNNLSRRSTNVLWFSPNLIQLAARLSCLVAWTVRCLKCLLGEDSALLLGEGCANSVEIPLHGSRESFGRTVFPTVRLLWTDLMHEQLNVCACCESHTIWLGLRLQLPFCHRLKIYHLTQKHSLVHTVSNVADHIDEEKDTGMPTAITVSVCCARPNRSWCHFSLCHT